MAAILERVFEKKVTPNELRKWLTRNYSKNETPKTLEELCSVQPEFIPFFLNFLRDQSAPVLQGCRSANATPSKTPTVLKTQRAITFGEPKTKTSTPRVSGSGEGKRVQLFAASPSEGESLTHPFSAGTMKAYHENSSLNFSSFESSRNSVLDSPGAGSHTLNTSGNAPVSPHPGSGHSKLNISPHPGFQGLDFSISPQAGSVYKRHASNSGRPTPHESTPSGRRTRTSPFHSFTPDSHRSQHRHCLGEYLVTSSRKKKSPNTVRRDDQPQHSPQGHQRSVGKGKNQVAGENKGWKVAPSNGVSHPGFELAPEDFPSLGGTGDVKTEEHVSQTRPAVETPRDDIVITPSRKVTEESRSSGQQVETAFDSPAIQARRVTTQPRRITPTAVSSQPVAGPNQSIFKSVSLTKVFENEELPSDNSAFSGPLTTEGHATLEQERQFLRDAKASQFGPNGERTPQNTSRLAKMIASQITPTKATLEHMANITEVTHPDPSKVTYRERLQLLSEVYSGCLQEQLVPNTIVELYFLIQLLTTKGVDADPGHDTFLQDEDDVSYLSSVHNAVYFAVAVLARLKKLVSLLDKGTLRLLVDNQRISDFDLDLHNDLVTMLDQTQAKTKLLPASSPILGVSFQADTDNRKNFPSDRAFHTFKKQRDQFYELLRDWQENHLQPGWSMRNAQSDRIRLLVGGQIDLVNHIHFTRLFQSQLIQMCKGDRGWRVEGDEENISLLSELKQTNPGKFKRLQERFITPQSVGSPCPHPLFPGCQEFFRDFVVVAASHLFNHHLTVTMASKIMELNTTQLSQQGTESDQEGEVDAEDLETLTTCVFTLRLLGKFLGFVTFLPYQSLEKIPGSMESTVLGIRNQTNPPVDLPVHIELCRVGGRLIMTIPWVVEFLSMMDPLAPRLDVFQLTLSLLVQVYRGASIQFQKTSSLTLLLVITMLGWLFELPVCPEGIFFKLFPADCDVVTQVPLDCVDLMDLVDHNVFYTCCPYVGELKSLLMGFAVGSNNKGSSIRKITPVHTDVELAIAVCDRQLQNQLEENFFHNHPASMKRTVEFVAERVSSNYIKQFRGAHLPRLIRHGIKKVKGSTAVMSGTLDSKTKRTARQEVEDLSLELASEGQQLAAAEVTEYVEKKIAAILPLMLPDDTSTRVIMMTSQICARLAHDKVLLWMGAHITKSMFLQEFSPELEKRIRYLAYIEEGHEALASILQSSVPASAKQASSSSKPLPSPEHDATGPFPSETMINFKDILRDLDREIPTTHSEILEQVAAVKWSLERRKDMLPATYNCFGRMVVTLTYILVIQYPSLWTAEVEQTVMSLCSTHLKPHVTFNAILCPKHVAMLAAALNDKLSWEKFTALLVTLLDRDLLTPERLEDSCLNIIQKAPSQYTLIHLSRCMCAVAQVYHERQMGITSKQHSSARPRDTEFVRVLECLSKLTGENSDLVPLFQTTNRLIVANQTTKNDSKEDKDRECPQCSANNNVTCVVTSDSDTKSSVVYTSMCRCKERDSTGCKGPCNRNTDVQPSRGGLCNCDTLSGLNTGNCHCQCAGLQLGNRGMTPHLAVDQPQNINDCRVCDSDGGSPHTSLPQKLESNVNVT